MIKEVRTPGISILMSIYNESESQIRESVSSILNQTFSDFELIIVCDNPNREDVDDIMSHFQDERIRLAYNEKNIGLAMSMNKAAELAKADIFARMDADDIAYPNRLQEEYIIFQDDNIDVVFTDYCYIDDQSNDINQIHSFPENVEGLVPSKMIATTPSLIHHPTVMMRREVFERVGGYRDFPCSQDRDLWYRMQEAGARFYLLNQILLKYRINPNSVTNKKFYQQQLTVHYINALSVERLQKGIDSYRKDNYASFLKKKGYYSVFKRKLFVLGNSFLDKASVSNQIMKYIYRILAFVISPQLRYNYLICKKKKQLIMNAC